MENYKIARLQDYKIILFFVFLFSFCVFPQNEAGRYVSPKTSTTTIEQNIQTINNKIFSLEDLVGDSIAAVILYADSTFVVNLVSSSESPDVVTLVGVNADGKTLFSRDIPVGGVNVSELQQQVNDNTARINNAEQLIQFFQQFAFPSIDENIQNILAEIEDIKGRIDSITGGSVDSLVLPVTNLVAVSDDDSAIVKVSWTNPTYTNTSLTALDTIIIQVRIADVTPFIQFTTLTPGTTSSATLSGGVITGGETVQVRVLRRRNNKTSINNPVSQEIVVFDTSSVPTYIAPVLVASAYQNPLGWASISWTQQGLVPPFYKLLMSINGGAYDSVAFYTGSQSNGFSINTGASSGDVVRFRLQPMDADTQEVNNISNIATITIPFPLTQPDSIIYYHTIYLNQSSGNDNFDGSTPSAAVQSFSRAQALATDTSRIKIIGNYTGYINITKSGLPGKPLKIVSDRTSTITAGNEARLTIRLSGNNIWVDSCYVVGWSGLATTSASPNTYPQGISIIGNNCIVSNCIVKGESDGIWDATGSSQTQTIGIYVQGLEALVRDNEVYYWGRLIHIQPIVAEPCSTTITRNKLHDTRPLGYNDGDAIKIASSSGDTHGLVISHNEVYGWSNDGVDGRGQGITVEYNEFHNPQNTMNTAIALKRGTGIPEQSMDGVVRYNIVRDCNVTNQLFAGGSAIVVSSSNTNCYYNLVYNISGVHGIKVDGVIGDGGNVDGINIFNNTVSDINMVNGNGGYGFRMENGAANHTGIQLINNIFDGDVADVYFGGNGTLRNNLLVNNKLTIRSGYTVTQSNNISGSAGFVSSTDLTLTQTSPAIDAGLDVGLNKDILGNLFVGQPDIGAYEYQGEGGLPTGDEPIVVVAAASNITSSTATVNASVYSGGISTTNKIFYGTYSWQGSGRSGIVLIGSSSTELPASAGHNQTLKWSQQLADTLGVRVVNRGKSGGNAYYFNNDVNGSWTQILADTCKYAIIMLGLNGEPAGSTFRGQLDSLIDKTVAAGMIPILMSTGMSVDYENGHYASNRDPLIIEKDTVVRNLAIEHSIGYIDIWQRSLDEIAAGLPRVVNGITYEAWDYRSRQSNACPNNDAFAPHANHDTPNGVETPAQDSYDNHIDLGAVWFSNIHLNPNGSYTVANEIGNWIRENLLSLDSITLSSTGSSAFETVTANLSGLEPNTQYYYYIRSQNAEGWDYSSLRTFTTLSGAGTNRDTVSVSVTSSENDIGYTLSSNSVNTTSTVIYAGFNNSERYSVFNIDLSSANLTGATVIAAVCSVWNYTSRSDSFRVIVRLSDTVNAVIPTSRDIAEAQAKTTAYAVFEKQDETTWSAGSLHTFDISPLIQELADSYGDDLGSVNIYWKSVNPQGHQQFRSYDNGNSPKSLTLNLIYEKP